MVRLDTPLDGSGRRCGWTSDRLVVATVHLAIGGIVGVIAVLGIGERTAGASSCCCRLERSGPVAACDAVGTADERSVERRKVGEVRERGVGREDVSLAEPEPHERFSRRRPDSRDSLHFVNTVWKPMMVKESARGSRGTKPANQEGWLTIPEVGELVEVEVVEFEHVVHGQGQDWIWECRRHGAPMMRSRHDGLGKIGGV